MKIVDFGISGLEKNFIGGWKNPWICPPECRFSSERSVTWDIYSLGILMWEMLTENSIKQYRGMKLDEFQDFIRCSRPNIEKKFQHYAIVPILHKCWAPVEQRFSSVSEVLNALRLHLLFERSKYLEQELESAKLFTKQ